MHCDSRIKKYHNELWPILVVVNLALVLVTPQSWGVNLAWISSLIKMQWYSARESARAARFTDSVRIPMLASSCNLMQLASIRCTKV